MTIKQFFKALAGLTLHWRDPDRWHGERVSLRAFLKDGRCLCPVTAVCYFQTGEYCGPGEWRDAAQFLNLNVGTAARIVTAADHRLDTTFVKKFSPAIRAELLKATELEGGEA